MGLWGRALQAIRANLGSMVSQAEDPEKVLEQAMAEMQNHLIQLRQAVAQALATQTRTERQGQQAQTLAQEWYNRAELALRQGDEPLARQALSRRQSYLGSAQAMARQVGEQQQLVSQLKDNMHRLEIKIAEARTQKDMFIARARSAAASQRLQEIMGSGGPIAAFDQMEQRILDPEARAQALGELSADPLEQQFAALEGSPPSVDSELALLKQRLNP